jgi:hypothetical protein
MLTGRFIGGSLIDAHDQKVTIGFSVRLQLTLIEALLAVIGMQSTGSVKNGESSTKNISKITLVHS